MSENLDNTLKKLIENMQSGKTQNYAERNGEISQDQPARATLGDPDCPICGGLGLIRQDHPLSHPDFGKIDPCTCRQQQVSQEAFRRLYAMSQLDELHNLTFENFQSRGRVGLIPQEANSIEMAFNQARVYAQNLNGWVFFQGGYGCGKTHLAAAIANFAVSLGVPTLFITVPDLLDRLRFSFDDAEFGFEERFNEIRQIKLLVLDDLGTQNATGWAQEKLYQIINYRYINRLPLVVTSNVRLERLEGRIRSRLEDPELVTKVVIQASDYRRPAGDPGLHEFAAFPKLQKCTFANFDSRNDQGLPAEDLKSLENAFRAARDFAQNPSGWIVLSGGSASGKTHLAAAIHNYRRDMGLPSRFVVVSDMLDYLRAAFNPTSHESLDQRFDEVRSTPYLILDGFGEQSSTPWANEKLYQLINHRYYGELPTVLTTNRQWDEIDPRLLSRIDDRTICKVFAIQVPAYTGAKKSAAGNPRKSRK